MSRPDEEEIVSVVGLEQSQNRDRCLPKFTINYVLHPSGKHFQESIFRHLPTKKIQLKSQPIPHSVQTFPGRGTIKERLAHNQSKWNGATCILQAQPLDRVRQ